MNSEIEYIAIKNIIEGHKYPVFAVWENVNPDTVVVRRDISFNGKVHMTIEFDANPEAYYEYK